MYPESSLGCCTVYTTSFLAWPAPHFSTVLHQGVQQCAQKLIFPTVLQCTRVTRVYKSVQEVYKSEPKAPRVVQHNHSAPLHQSKPVICVFGRTVSLTHVCRLYKNVLCSMMVIQRFALQRLLVAVTTLERDSPISIFIFTIGALSTIGG